MVMLSLVITSWGGTFMATTCRVTLRMRSMPNGSIRIRPGPLGRASTRPSRKITPRSYSCKTEIMVATAIPTRTRTTITNRTTTPVLIDRPSRPGRPIPGCRDLVCHGMDDAGAPFAQVGDRLLGEAAHAARHRPQERVGERRVAEVAEDRHLEQRQEAPVGDAVVPVRHGAPVPHLPQDPGAEAGHGDQQHRPVPALADEGEHVRPPAAQLGDAVEDAPGRARSTTAAAPPAGAGSGRRSAAGRARWQGPAARTRTTASSAARGPGRRTPTSPRTASSPAASWRSRTPTTTAR